MLACELEVGAVAWLEGTAEGFGCSFVWAAAAVGVVLAASHSVVVKQARMRCRGRQC
jgi:hypothetical protein